MAEQAIIKQTTVQVKENYILQQDYICAPIIQIHLLIHLHMPNYHVTRKNTPLEKR